MRAKLLWDQYYCILEGQMFNMAERNGKRYTLYNNVTALVYGPLYSPLRGPLIHGTDRTGPDQIHTLFYGTDRTMNAEFKRMRQVCCHMGMESHSVTSARDGSAWVRLVDIKRSSWNIRHLRYFDLGACPN